MIEEENFGIVAIMLGQMAWNLMRETRSDRHTALEIVTAIYKKKYRGTDANISNYLDMFDDCVEFYERLVREYPPITPRGPLDTTQASEA